MSDRRSFPWKRVSDYCIRHGEFRVCKVTVMGKDRYEAWRHKELLGSHALPAAAKAQCENHTTTKEAA